MNQEELTILVDSYFMEYPGGEHLPDGAQLWNGKWWVPRWGCDTLSEIVDEVFIQFLIMCDNEADRSDKQTGSTHSSTDLPTD